MEGFVVLPKTPRPPDFFGTHRDRRCANQSGHRFGGHSNRGSSRRLIPSSFVNAKIQLLGTPLNTNDKPADFDLAIFGRYGNQGFTNNGDQHDPGAAGGFPGLPELNTPSGYGYVGMTMASKSHASIHRLCARQLQRHRVHQSKGLIGRGLARQQRFRKPDRLGQQRGNRPGTDLPPRCFCFWRRHGEL